MSLVTALPDSTFLALALAGAFIAGSACTLGIVAFADWVSRRRLGIER